MEYVKQTMFGYSQRNSLDDPETTHVVLTKDEYRQLQQEIKDADREAYEVRVMASQEQRGLTNSYESRIHGLRKQHEAELDALREELREERTERAYHENLNINLLRIAKERANADRDLRPKKQHTGYVVISSMERDVTYKDLHQRPKTERLWETVLQTPYSVGVTDEQAWIQSKWDLLCEEEDGSWMIEKIGINGFYEDSYGKLPLEKGYQEFIKRNIWLAKETRLRANYRAGYWELLMQHTKPLGVVPVEMRPSSR